MCGKPFVFYSISKTYKVYDINLSLRKAQRKMATSFTWSPFFFVLCNAPPQAGRDVGAQRRNPWEWGIYSVALALAFQLARAPPARCKECRSVATKSLSKINWTEFWTRFCNTWFDRVLNIFHFNQGDRFVIWNYIILIMKNQVSDRGGYLVWFHSFFYESQFCDSAKESIYFLHTSIFYCYLL